MPQTIRKLIFSGTGTGGSPALVSSRPDVASVADCRGYTVRAIEVRVTGAGTPTFTIEVSPGASTEAAPTNWTAAAFRAPGGGAYASAAVGLAAGSAQVYHLDPADYAPWVRLNVATNPSNALIEAWVEQEV